MRVGDTPNKPSSVSAIRHKLRLRKQLEQDLAHVTQEMYRRNRELADTNRTLTLLQTINTFALDSHASLDAICVQITNAIANTAEFPLVAILTGIDDSAGGLQLRNCKTTDVQIQTLLAHLGPKRLKRLRLDAKSFDEVQRSRAMSVSDITGVEMRKVLGTSAESVQTIKKQTDIKSLYVVKLVARSRLVGLLVAGFAVDVAALSAQDTQLLDWLGEPVGVALDNRILYEENQRVLDQLRRTNEKLKALDETKDEFITMASHQLRTPLTSVKGYLSMVLEGDAGKLNANQQKLLEQSFNSSQRMVYLISDLLNLSRLSTGKFVIESHPVDLSEAVQLEVDQLAETAKSHGLELVYKRPVAFPKLMLDETKIHQVIMNFIDNAIYYTPSGGTVTVELHETPTAVECLVHDTGIGVPRSAQHRLFAKFYRAQNAQHARPDGTGLGLFMAKKVVVAQNGSIVFESEEGKGSTFGFRFSKAAHAVPDGPQATAASA